MSTAPRLSDEEVLAFTKHLAVTIKAGIPLAEALVVLTNEASGKQKRVIASILAGVEGGERLQTALAKASPAFDAIYLAMVGIGEESGKLDETLAFLAQQLAKVYNLRRKIRGAMLYPGLVVSLMLVIGMALSIFVLPKLTDFFAAFEAQLPLSTTILLWFATLMKESGVVIVGAICASLVAAKWLLNTRWLKSWWQRQLLRLPYIGQLNQASKVAEMLRNLGILLQSGVPIMRAWAIVAGATSNEYLRRELEKVGKGIEKGSMISEVMSQEKVWVVPLMAQKMLAIGERTGKVDELALYLADYYEEELDAASKNLTTVLEPILLVVVGLMVAFLAMAIISPIYQITGSIGG